MNAPGTYKKLPDALGHYRLISPIGYGGMGLVYLARDTRLEREVAIKCLRSELFEDHYIKKFRREALLLAKLNHPNIVHIYDFIETQDQLALVMELVDGENMQVHLREHIVPISQRMRWLVQISDGLAVAHDAGIIHRDLKPENILINKFSQAKISDLGIAQTQDLHGSYTDHCAGSYCFMSPEQAVGDPIDFKSDLFSLGILAYQLLCGAHPFGSSNNKLQIMQCIISQPPTPPNQYNIDLAPEIVNLLELLLAKNPNNRPDNTNWVAKQFKHLCDLTVGPQTQNDTQALPHSKKTINEIIKTQILKTAPLPIYTKIKTLYSIFINLPTRKKRVGLAASLLILVVAFMSDQQNDTHLNSDKTTQLPIHLAVLATQKKENPSEVFSQSQLLKNGFDALQLFDRPGSLEAAENSFQAVLNADAKNAAAVAGLSLVYSYRYSGDSEDPIWLQKADASAQQALQLNAQLALSHIAMGRVFSAKAKHNQALAAFDTAQLLEPTSIFTWRGRVSALRSAQRYDEAIELANQGLEKFPHERFFADELGTIYVNQLDYIKAEEAFRLSIKLQPDSVYAYASLYIALERQNRADEAMQVLQQGLQIRSSAWLHGNLGNALFLRGDYLGAADAFEAAVSPTKGNPGSYLAWANLADTLRWIPGRESESQRAYARALDIMAPLLKHRENDVTLVSRMALYLARLNNREQAKPMLNHALTLAPQNASVHFRVGLAFETLKDHDAALSALTKAIDLGFPKKLIEAEPDLLNLRRTSGAF